MKTSILSLLVVLGLAAAQSGFAKEVSSKSPGGFRKLASVQSAPSGLGQGQEMLGNVTASSPEFLGGRRTARGPVKIAGVCYGSDGHYYQSSNPGYASCISAQSRASGSSVNDYFGPAQRQAGIGLLVGP